MESSELGAFTLCFNKATFRKSSSFRNYKGTYQTEEDGIHVYLLEMTTTSVKDCAQKDRMSESIYTSMLGMMEQYSVSPNRLELYAVQHVKLVELNADGTQIC